MSRSKPLDAFTLPLQGSSAIEASAGTGKTYTIVSLYLRLLLGVGCEPLSMEQILLVTYTRAATQELKDRVRYRVRQLRLKFEAYQQALSDSEAAADALCQTWEEEAEYDLKLLRAVLEKQCYEADRSALDEAILRLLAAEQNGDQASIFTIHGFCQRVLNEFAFYAKLPFSLTLSENENELIEKSMAQVWREAFYPLEKKYAAFIAKNLKSPQDALAKIRAFLEKNFRKDEEYLSLSEFKQEIDSAEIDPELIQQFCEFWSHSGHEMHEFIKAEIACLNGASYKENKIESAFQQLQQASKTKNITELDQYDIKYFYSSFLISKIKKAHTEQILEKLEKITAFKQFESIVDLIVQKNELQKKQAKLLTAKLLHHLLIQLRERVEQNKTAENVLGFSDLLNYLAKALDSSNGEQLAAQLRQKYPFAMIDEFQDTDDVQFYIFKKIYLAKEAKTGFIVIGDPKQSIYRFRGAEIEVYLKANEEVKHHFMLKKNWRSVSALVEQTNQLFYFTQTDENDSKNSPFITEGIQFESVDADENKKRVLISESDAENNQSVQGIHYYLTENKAEPAKYCAYLIYQQLLSAEQGKFNFVEENTKDPISSKDITILVNSYVEAEKIIQALAEYNIPAVYLSNRKGVFNSQEAKELYLILRACLQPNNERALLSALGTSLFGLSAAELLQLRHDESQLESQIELFNGYQVDWKKLGVLPMLYKIFFDPEKNIIAKLKQKKQATRRITDLLHLSELLQQKMGECDSEQALLSWFEHKLNQVNENAESDEFKLRLETEENVIKIITIHSSKGLQFPIVWLPFEVKEKIGSQSDLTLYSDKDRNKKWYFSLDEIESEIKQKERSELMRLFYVAMTRAEYQTNVIVSTKSKDKQWFTLDYLLSKGKSGNIKADIASAIQPEQGYVHVLNEEIPEATKLTTQLSADTENKPRQFTGKIKQHWTKTSYSRLMFNLSESESQKSVYFAETANEELENRDAISAEFETELGSNNNELPIAFRLKKGRETGNALHAFFEKIDFKQIQAEKLAELNEALNLTDEAEQTELAKWLQNVLNTTLLPNDFALSDISSSKRLNELKFALRLSNPNALLKLNSLLRDESKLGEKIHSDLNVGQINGFIEGIIDCIFEHQGKYYLLDYKSNYLGDKSNDYAQDSLEQAMIVHRYDLQYMLYCLALHRYLRYRLPNYDYARDVGGVIYLFVRGVQAGSDNGIFTDKPSQALIEKLDQLFD